MTLGTGSEVAHIPCPSGSIGDVLITYEGSAFEPLDEATPAEAASSGLACGCAGRRTPRSRLKLSELDGQNVSPN